MAGFIEPGKNNAEIEKNTVDGVEFYNILSGKFEVSGLAVAEKGKFYRFPDDVMKQSDEFGGELSELAKQTAGACVRFRTDSPKISVKVTLTRNRYFSHMAPSGYSGCDVWFDRTFSGMAVRPGEYGQLQYEGTVKRPWYLNEGMHDVRINLPLYNGISDMEIGVCEGSKIEAATPYAIKKPVLFFGSSITQGACATKPGNAYPTMLSRYLDFELINLGFSDNARGQLFIADYIASLDLAAFVMDYDHNDALPQLKERHEPFFKRVREKRPDMPILLPSRGDYEYKAENEELRKVVRRTYDNAVKNGDKNVWFLDGETMFGKDDRGACTVDGGHPTDFGMKKMADSMLPILKEMLKK